MKGRFLITTTLLLNSVVVAKPAEFLLATYNAPPYQYIENKVIKGITVSTVQCIFHKLNRKIEIDFYPLKRSLRELKRNNISGVFPITSDDKKNVNSTSPISIEKWYWLTNFQLTDQVTTKTFSKKLIGAVNGSPAHDWLLKNKLDVGIAVTTREQLLNMFIAGRVDAIIIDDNEANRDIEFHQMIRSVEHNWRFIKFESHHFAFSDNAVRENRDIINQFNNNISSCNPLSLKLSYNEKQLLINYLAPYLNKLSHFLNKARSPAKLTDIFSTEQLKTIDKTWDKEVKTQSGSLYNSINNSELSVFLSKLQKSSLDAITEIIAIDDEGYTIALSSITSDLYQGDEPQFLNTFPGGPNTFYIGDIKYDASTHTFQSQVSFALNYKKLDKLNDNVKEAVVTSNSTVAVVTFGVNVEKVIQEHNNNNISFVSKR
ncbi:transporter substrate-binding domain-containing protein [Colwellia sp. E2M01]|uniref:substrate-binding periplasmic protein n=1 Tax=Colwellia sp. E2M01 TaxID=2841561 RepID=UPI001C088F0D|nr:transporter substrate-binding domain-containing protein [Colwellia sp. E2M01]MBU2870592.1 transporter substrate-binding domain-containing protein [Colwellia sp. E2M01]